MCNVLGIKAGGTVSNISVSIFAWMAQLADVSFRAVTRMEYLCATVMVIRSIGDSSTSVYPSRRSVRFLECCEN